MTASFFRRISAVTVLFTMLATALTGCWDIKELEKQLILTAIAIDVSDNPEQICVSAQVANITQEKSNSGTNGGTDGSDAFFVMQATGDSFMECLSEIDQNSSQNLLVHHNQIRLVGIELAEQGIGKHLDMILREQKIRLEVPLAVIDGRGEDALTAKLSEMPISGVLLGNFFQDMAGISPQYKVRTVDFICRYLDGTAAQVIPIIKLTGETDKQEIKLDGMAVFREGKMVGRLTNEDTLGYIFTFGKVKRCNMAVSDEAGRAELYILKLDCKRKVSLRQDGGVLVSLSINTIMNISEVYDFEKMTPQELLKHLESLAQEEIKNKIMNCLIAAQALDADIFGFCTMVYKKYPKKWSKMKDKWNEVFTDIEIDMKVKINITDTGQIVQSLDMEKNVK